MLESSRKTLNLPSSKSFVNLLSILPSGFESKKVMQPFMTLSRQSVCSPSDATSVVCRLGKYIFMNYVIENKDIVLV